MNSKPRTSPSTLGCAKIAQESGVVTDRHPFVKATLQRAIRALLKDKHNHSTLHEMSNCHECVNRLWVELGRVAPREWIGGR